MSAFFKDGLKNIAVDVDASPRIRLLRILNLDAAVAYLQLFAKPAASVAVGVDVPDWQIAVGSKDSITLPFEDPVPLCGGLPGFSILASTLAGGGVAPATGLAVSIVTK